MKKALLHLLPLIAVLTMFVSCQKAEDITLDNFRTPLTAEEYIEKYMDQKIVFQYGELNPNGQVKEGWVVTTTGQVLSFDFGETNWNPEEHSCSIDDMAKLEGIVGNELGTVELEDLVENFKLIDAAYANSPMIEMPEAANSSIFYAYRLRATSNHSSPVRGNCGSGRDDAASFVSPYYDQVLLEYQGDQNIANTSAPAKKILTWLKEIQTDLGR